MFTFLKAQAASLVASAVDFVVTVVLAEMAGVWYMAATMTGTVAGGVTHFTLGRHWVFEAGEGRVQAQVLRYFLIWNGSFLLNAAGVYVLTQGAGFNYIFSKIATALAVGFFYNYIIQKRYVFR